MYPAYCCIGWVGTFGHAHSCFAAKSLMRALYSGCPILTTPPVVVRPAAIALDAQQRCQLGRAMALQGIPARRVGWGGASACSLHQPRVCRQRATTAA